MRSILVVLLLFLAIEAIASVRSTNNGSNTAPMKSTRLELKVSKKGPKTTVKVTKKFRVQAKAPPRNRLSEKTSKLNVDEHSNFLSFDDIRTQVPEGFVDEYLHGPMKTLEELFYKLLGVSSLPNEKGTRSEFATYALTDHSNDKLVYATTQELILQAGFKYENHYAQADDGYITQLVRIINPLADRKQLKQPPVALFHGGTLDTSNYVMQSTSQHHPERWPRVHGQIHTSWNRSLGFLLANNGYDVWLVGTRGCNRANQGHRWLKKWTPLLSLNIGSSPSWMASNWEASRRYWMNYTLDDIGDKEMPRQIDRILQLTGARRVSMLVYSITGPPSMALLSTRPEYAEKVHNYVLKGPIMSDRNAGRHLKLLWRLVSDVVSDELGSLIIPELALSQPVRNLVLAIAESPLLRYTLVKLVTLIGFGSSPKFNTFLEPGLFNRVLLPASFTTLRHICKIASSGKIQRYDFGPIGNALKYGSVYAPEYDLSKMNPHNWLVVTAENDPLNSLEDVQKLAKTAPKKPFKHVYVKNANHLDLTTMVEVDKEVYLPILEFLDTFQLPRHRNEPSAKFNRLQWLINRKIDKELERFVPPNDRTPNGYHL